VDLIKIIMKKIAFCISGHLRKFDEIHENFLEFKKHLEKIGNVDIFISTWDEIDNYKYCGSANSRSEIKNKKINLDLIKNTYNPLALSIFSYNQIENYLINNPFKADANYDFFGDRYSHKNIPHNMRALFLLNECCNLKKNTEIANNFTYDIVFRIRPDFIFDKNEYSKFNYENIEDYFYAAGQDDCDISDIFGFSNSHIYDKYCKTFFNLNNIDKTFKSFNEQIAWGSVLVHPEIIIHKNSILEKFNFKLINYFGSLSRDI